MFDTLSQHCPVTESVITWKLRVAVSKHIFEVSNVASNTEFCECVYDPASLQWPWQVEAEKLPQSSLGENSIRPNAIGNVIIWCLQRGTELNPLCNCNSGSMPRRAMSNARSALALSHCLLCCGNDKMWKKTGLMAEAQISLRLIVNCSSPPQGLLPQHWSS